MDANHCLELAQYIIVATRSGDENLSPPIGLHDVVHKKGYSAQLCDFYLTAGEVELAVKFLTGTIKS